MQLLLLVTSLCVLYYLVLPWCFHNSEPARQREHSGPCKQYISSMRRCPLFIGCRRRREEGPQEAVGGGQESRRRWWEVGRRTQDCRCCLWGRDRLLALICPSEPSSELPIKMTDSCWWMEERGLKGPARLHRVTCDFSLFVSERGNAVCEHDCNHICDGAGGSWKALIASLWISFFPVA